MSDKTQTDAKGREVFTVHPEILAGGAAYRKAAPDTEDQDQDQDEDRAGRPAAAKDR